MNSIIRVLEVNLPPEKESIHDFFGKWFTELPEKLWPEYISASGDDVGETIPPGDPTPIIRFWNRGGMLPFVGRNSDPAYILRRRFQYPENSPPTPQNFTLALESSPSSELAKGAFAFLFRASQAKFASLCSKDEFYGRHWFSVEIPEEYSVVETNRGLTVEETIPGVYFRTFFSHDVIEEYDLSLSGIGSLADRFEEVAHGYMVSAYENGDLLNTEEAREIEQAIERQMNNDAFFHPEDITEEQLREEARIR